MVRKSFHLGNNEEQKGFLRVIIKPCYPPNPIKSGSLLILFKSHSFDKNHLSIEVLHVFPVGKDGYNNITHGGRYYCQATYSGIFPVSAHIEPAKKKEA